MMLNVAGKNIETNEQGFLCNLADWNEDFTEVIAKNDGVDLYNDHWELILYFREYYEENQKEYEKHIYKLLPKDPAHEVCKLAGLPMPQPDD